ncbi:cell wall-associated NlpC family hydrolase [Acetoanaerobium pronyense]|uniref:Cell wall-associated NlpC family hydrolase n=1 Tax=Acetoanaerobium pronyense TaxID=1482736 RepID=A0ABS4KKW9_9FIRM|nr:glucosaminidase domain-containing protein [Acetoanaerobium pronyense]MBP2028437.1 cell wall-associated NlpC family hydrolase [Acetoanaerobium pronyense]
MQTFIDKLVPAAKRNHTEHNILPSLTIAQAILESNWGRSRLAVQGNNLFGIKADSRWTGKRISFPTQEFVNGKMITVQAYFRAYDSVSASIEDHGRFLLTQRYAKVRQSKNYKEAANEIWKAGYATDPKYPEKLISIIEKYKLYEYDQKEGETLVNRHKIIEVALMLQSKNVKYRLGAKAVPPRIPTHLDCSGFVRYCYLASGSNVKDGTWHQWHDSNPVKLSDLRIGDLGFLQPASSPGINHIGLYAGDGKWIHCNSSRNGITLEKTNIFPYTRRFKGINFTNVIEEDEDMAREKVSDRDLNSGIAAIKNLAKLKIINSPDRHIEDLKKYPWDWRMWVVQNNIAERVEGK